MRRGAEGPSSPLCVFPCLKTPQALNAASVPSPPVVHGRARGTLHADRAGPGRTRL